MPIGMLLGIPVAVAFLEGDFANPMPNPQPGVQGYCFVGPSSTDLLRKEHKAPADTALGMFQQKFLIQMRGIGVSVPGFLRVSTWLCSN